MKKTCLCPRAEICGVYRAYVDYTKDDTLGVISVSSIENTDFYTCKALSAVLKLAKEGTLPEEFAKRLEGTLDCLLIDMSNRLVPKHRPDL